MDKKGISAIIGALIVLLITIMLGGITYSYVLNTLTGHTKTSFEIIDTSNTSITIKNTGTSPINSVTAKADDNDANIVIVPNLQGLVGYWSFNEGSGSTADDNSGNNNIGNLNPLCPDCPAWVDGKFGKALRFDGINDYVDVLGIKGNSYTSAITVSAWVYFNTVTPAEQDFISSQNSNVAGWGMYANTKTLKWTANVGSFKTATFTSSAQTGVWYHLVGTFDGSNLKAYLNGNLVATTPASGFITGDTTTLKIGEFGTGGSYTNAIIDEVGIYNRALSDSEIQQLYSSFLPAGQVGTIKILTPLTKGIHNLKLCTSSMCTAGPITIN